MILTNILVNDYKTNKKIRYTSNKININKIKVYNIVLLI